MMHEETKSKILVVDDERRNLLLLESLLNSELYEVTKASSGAECLETLDCVQPDLIILDIIMPGMDGIEVCQEIKRRPSLVAIPIIFVTGLDDRESRLRGIEAGGDDFLIKPIDMSELLARTANLLKLKRYHDEIKKHRDQLEIRVRERTAELKEAHEETLLRLSIAAEYKDNDTGAHLLRLSGYAELMGRAMGMAEPEVQMLRQAAVTHDIGKIGVPESILAKDGPLNDDEWTIMRTHPVIGSRILANSKSSLLRLSQVVAEYHHERWDGKGYPCGICGEKIPLSARIVAVADVFDALTSRRSYKDAFSIGESVEIIRGDAGSHFDPDVVNAFNRALDAMVQLHHAVNSEDHTCNSYVIPLAHGYPGEESASRGPFASR